jgi:hypothetical protein
MNNENQNIKCASCRKLKTKNEYTINIKTNILYKCCKQCNKYYKENKEQIRKQQNEYCNEYFKNINNRIRNRVNCRINTVIENKIRDYKFYLGCDINEYILYLESKFKDGMNLENYGSLWCIDHIRPLKPKIKISQEETIKRLHFKNTQPLYCIENLIKFNKETVQETIQEIIENKEEQEEQEEEEQEYAEIIFIDEDEVLQVIIDTYL